MFDLGVAMREQTLRRQHPDESDEQIRRRVQAWLLERPGAPFGDCVGIQRTDLIDS